MWRFLALPVAFMSAVSLGGCSPPTDPKARFDWIEIGMRRERVESYYGLPNSLILYYEPRGNAVFINGLLRGTSNADYSGKPSWPVNIGMSRTEFEAVMGPPDLLP
jgi:hypothetical protein